MKNRNLTTQRRVLDGLCQASVMQPEMRDRNLSSEFQVLPPKSNWKKSIALMTVVFFAVFTVAPSWTLAETVKLEGGTVDVSTQDNTTNWNVSGNPVWNVPEFNIPQGSTYNIAGLGSGSSLALLVGGGSASNILGTMNLSNLAFILQNIAGINIGSTGLINLNNASLIASTLPLNLDATRFLAQDYQFGGQGGFLMNEGKIIGKNADLVALIANALENRGVIDVPTGTVVLATGSMVTVGISGDGLVSIGVDEATANEMGLADQIRNTGTISAEGGRVILNAKAMDGLFEKAISLDQDGSALSAIKANNGSVEFVGYNDFYNSGSLSAANGHILVDSKGNITNEGVVNALNGTIEMTAGQSVYNKNLIDALGGKVEITAAQGEVKNTGTIDVTNGALKVTAREDVVNEALIKALEGEINVTSTEGAITNAGTMDAEKGSIEMQAAGTIETKGILKAGTFRESGATFLLGGTYQVGTSYHNNLDGALKFIPTDTGGPNISGTITDAGDVIVETGTAVTLTGPTSIVADDDTSGSGFFEMRTGSSIAGGGFDLSITAGNTSGGTATENRLRSISNVGILSLNASAGGTPTYVSDPTPVTGAVWTNITDFRINSGKLNRFTGDGSSATPYMIYDVYGLQGMQGYLTVGTYFRLANDINATSTSTWNGGLGFDPVGTSTATYDVIPTSPFRGTFDGRSYTITGLTINRPLENYVGLFGATLDATVHNVGLIGGSMTGKDVVGSLAGDYYRSNLTKTYATSDVTGEDFVGGLVGASYQASTITNSYAAGDVVGTGDGAGGLVGYNFVSTIYNSFAVGEITGAGTSQGGFIGKQDASTLWNNWWWKSAGHNPTLPGAGTGDPLITTDEIDVKDTLESFYLSSAPVYISTATEGWDFDMEWLENAGALPTFGINPDTYLWIGTGLWSTASNWSKNGVAVVPVAGSVVGFNQASSGASEIDTDFAGGSIADIRIKEGYTGTITQNRSLEVTGRYVQEGGTVLAPFSKTFSAANFAIPGGVFNRFTGSGTAIDPYIINDVYSLQGMKGFLASGTYFELAGDISFSAAQQLWNYKGSGLVTDPLNYSGFDPVGGLVGGFSGNFNGNYHVISNLMINRPLSSDVGLFGKTDSATVQNVGLDGGSVTGGSNTGSLVGHNYESNVANSYATLAVSGTQWVGGLVGFNEKNSTITKSYATGDVTHTGGATDRGAGGLVGGNFINSNITYSYATGDIVSNTDAGGLVGSNESLSNISYSYSTGHVQGHSSYSGGFLGWDDAGSTVTYNYWDTQTSGMSTSKGQGTGAVEGKTTAQMKQMTTFYRWDPGIWGLKAGVTYPTLALHNTQWTGAAGDGKWSTPGNWITNMVTNTVAPGVNDLVFFNDAGVDEASEIDVDFGGSVAYLGVGSGYGTTILTQSRTLTTGDFGQGGGVFNGGDTINANGFVLNGGTFTAPTTLNLTGGWAKSGGTFDSNSGSVIFGGTGDQTILSGGTNFNILTIDRTGTIQLQDNLTASGQLTVTSGTLDPNLKTISQGGNWVFTNLTLINLGSVILTGAGKEITSNGEHFHNLTISGTYSLADALYIVDSLTVSAPGILDGVSKAMTFEKNVNITNVINAGAVAATGLLRTITSGGRPFGSLSISGTYVLNDPLTVTGDLYLDYLVGPPVTGTLAVGGNTISEGGHWSFAGLSGLGNVILTGSPGKQISSAQGNQFGNLTITGNYYLSGGLTVTGVLDVSTGTLNANNQSMTLGHDLDLTNITNVQDVTLYGSGSITSSDEWMRNLRITGAYSLVDDLQLTGWMSMWTTPELPDVPAQTGTLDADGNSMTVSSYDHVLHTGYSDYAGLDLTPITNVQNVTLTGSKLIISDSKAFNDLTISADGVYTLWDALQVDGALSVTGTLNASSQLMTLHQDLNLTNISNPQDVILTGSGILTPGGREVRNLTISGDYSLAAPAPAGALHVNGLLNVSGTLNAANNTMTIGGSLDLTKITGAYDVILDGSPLSYSLKSAGDELHNLTISGSYSLDDALHVNGVLNVNGQLSAAGNAITLAGNLDLTHISNAGAVTLDGASGSITSGGQSMDSLTIAGNYSLVDSATLADPLTVLHDLDIQGTGSLDALGQAISEGGDWSFSRLSNWGAVTLTGSSKMITSGGSEFNNLTITGNYTLFDALHMNGALDVSNSLDAAGKAITAGQSLDLTNIFNPGDITLDGLGSFSFKSHSRDLNSLTVSGNYTLYEPVIVTHDLDVLESGTLNVSGQAITEGGAWSFDRLSNWGAVTLTGSGDINSSGNHFSDLTISGTGAYTLTNALVVTGALDVQGTLNAASQAITAGQSLDLTNISSPWDVTLDSNNPGFLTSNDKVLNNLTFSGSNKTLVDAISVDGVLDASAGALDAAGQAITVKHNLDLSAFSNVGNVTLAGSGSLNSATKELGDLTVSGDYSLIGAAHVNGALSVTGTLNAAGYAMTLGQSLDLTKITNYGNMTLDGSGSIRSSSMVLNNLTISGNYSLADALHVDGVFSLTGAGTLNAVGNAMTLAGDLNLTHITNPGNITLTSSGTITSDSKAINDLTISGDYSLSDALHVNGALNVTGTLNILGNPMTLAQSLDLTKIPDAQTVTLDGSGTITSGGHSINTLTISGAYTLVDELTVTGELALQGTGTLAAASETITEGGNWVGHGMSNLGAVILTGSGKTITSNSVSFGSLTITGAYTLVDALVVAGDLDIQGTLNAATKAITEGGSWLFTGLSNHGDVTLTGSIKTITSSSNEFGNLTISGSYTLADALHVNGNFNVTGSLDAAGYAMTLDHDINITGLTNVGDMTLTGSGTITSGGNHFSSLTISGAYSLADALTVTGDLDVQGTLDAVSETISEGGNWVFTNLSNYGDVVLTGSGTITSGGNEFNALLISGTYTLVDALHLNGGLSVTGTLDAAGNAMRLPGNLNLTNISSAGDVTLEGPSGTITSGGKSVGNLTVSGTYSLEDALTATGDLSILGTLDAASKAISVGGNWAFVGGLSNLGAVTLTGSGKTITSGGNSFTDLTVSGVYSLADALHVSGVLDVTGSLSAASKAMTFDGDLDLTNVTNIQDITLAGAGSITSASKQVNNLTVSGTYMLDDALQVNGALDITGTLNVASQAMTLAQGLDLTKISNAGDVTLTGSGSINTNGQSVDDLTISGTYTQNSSLTVDGDFTVQTGGTFTDASPLSHDFTVAGSFSVPYGTNAFVRYTGSGTVGDPYVIRSDYDLQGMKGNLTSHFILNGSLDMASSASWNNNAGFDPIGDGTNAFTGSLDGNEKVISNLEMARTGSDYSGLFGNIGAAGSVSDLALESVSVYGTDYVGGLAGLNAGSLSNVYTTGAYTVSGVNYVGGLVGNNTGSILNAYSAAHVVGTDSVGGLVGANSGTLDKTYAMGYVTGTSNAGGLVGSGAGSVTNSYWDTEMTGKATSAGGTGRTTAEMMSTGTYSGWDFQNTWVMDSGGTYAHFRFRYPTGVRGVWGHVYSSTGVLAAPGTSVSVYYIPNGTATEILLDSSITGASSVYYVPLSQAAVGDLDYVMSSSLTGTSRMIAETKSIYPLYVINGQNLTLVRPGPTPDPKPIVITPVVDIPLTFDRSLVDAGNIPVPLPSITPAINVTIIDQTEVPVGGGSSVPEVDSLILPSQSSGVTPPVFRFPQYPVLDSTLQDRGDNGFNNEVQISTVTEPPAGYESVPMTTEVSDGVNSLWHSEQGGREITTDIWMDESGQGVEKITTDIRMDEGGSSSFESIGENSSWRNVPLLNFFGNEYGVEEITTDIQMIEGAGQ